MPTDYGKKKNAELEDLLKARKLAHTGKKAELIARLQQHDAEQEITSKGISSKPPGSSVPPAGSRDVEAGDDVIDWEDDAAAASTETGAAAIAAGGVGVQPPNPTAVPNQTVDTDPSKTSDLKVVKPTDKDTATNGAPSTEKAAKPAEPPPDFTSGVKETSLDEELGKRQKRAARFGITESKDDALKALERARKFGTTTEDNPAVKGLDQALPEPSKKRGRGTEQENGAAGGRKDGAKRSRVRSEGLKRGGGCGSGGAGLSEKDRLAAEARKKRFTAAT